MDYYHGGGPVTEFEELALVEMFGAQAVYGGLVSLEHMRRLLITDRISTAWESRKRSGDWVEWAKQNPDYNKLLIWAERLRDG